MEPDSSKNSTESNTEMADKAVSTEDLFEEAQRGIDIARMEAVISTLIENKVEAMKAERGKSSSDQSSPRTSKRQRITSTSTGSDSHHTSIQSYHGGHRHSHTKSHRKKKYSEGDLEYEMMRKRKLLRKNGASRRSRSPSPNWAKNGEAQVGEAEVQEVSEASDFVQNYSALPEQTCMDPCSSQPKNYYYDNNGPLKIHYDEDYVSLNMEEYGDVEEDAIIAYDAMRRARKKRHRKKKRKKSGSHHHHHHHNHHHQLTITTSEEEVKVIDPDDLPQRARWTIAATAGLLLAMCLLLVGVTLRMAPLIDEMVRKENEEMMNSYRGPVNQNTNNNVSSNFVAAKSYT